ncbi:MAG: YgdI/YgdR family lipoprotein [Burkholderiaceae bacterium]|nr:MAG: YgdI/YgdR family lipoprotein [Burkholderiaceae bacterium]TAM04308.1 MAG: YgdI/YgdR family lipoprotein [Pusillimonas sp.]
MGSSRTGGIAACSTPAEITTQDGQKIMTADKPRIDSKDGFVTYEKDGKEVKVNSNNVKSIEEVK